VIRTALFIAILLLALPGSAQELKVLNRSNPGEHFEVKQYLTRDKLNVVVFYSSHSPACERLRESLEGLARRRRDLAFSLVDVDRRGSQDIDWKSPLVRQYNLKILPYVYIMDAAGESVVQGHEARKKILEWVEE
tara:strand:- start:121 stop:525 length:405 start_codon:yes stop_codon:yes gene_type:complete